MMNELLTVQQVADRLQLNIATIRRYIKEGKLEAHRLGNHQWRIYQADLDEFIERGK